MNDFDTGTMLLKNINTLFSELYILGNSKANGKFQLKGSKLNELKDVVKELEKISHYFNEITPNDSKYTQSQLNEDKEIKVLLSSICEIATEVLDTYVLSTKGLFTESIYVCNNDEKLFKLLPVIREKGIRFFELMGY